MKSPTSNGMFSIWIFALGVKGKTKIANPMCIIYFITLLASGLLFAFEVNEMQYHFWFKDKIHKKWILEEHEECFMLTCITKCQKNIDCNGLALGPLSDDVENYTRHCYLLSRIDEEECDQDYDCSQEGVQIYSVSFLADINFLDTLKC